MNRKITALHYVLHRLVEWQERNYNYRGEYYLKNNDVSILLALNMIYFLCTINVKYGENLVSIFDNFYITPLGFKEKDLYDYMKENKHIIDYGKTYKEHLNFSEITNKDKIIIDNCFDELMIINKGLVYQTAFYLTDLTYETCLFFEESRKGLHRKIKSADIINTKNKRVWYTF